jgi:hypothetical protein
MSRDVNNKILFYKETGMFIDWKQLNFLPEIDTYIDIGFGPKGSPDLLKKFHDKRLILIDPLFESEQFARLSLKKDSFTFYNVCVGSFNGQGSLNVEENIARSTLLEVTDINFESEVIDKRKVKIYTLDKIMEFYQNEKAQQSQLGRIGIKIDTEGYELEVIKGMSQTLTKVKFLLIEARHNHTSFEDQYKLKDLTTLMHNNNFVLSMILTAKPFISDLVFVPVSN